MMYKNEYSNSNNKMVFFSPLIKEGIIFDGTEFYKITGNALIESEKDWINCPLRKVEYTHEEKGEEVGVIVDSFFNDSGFINEKGEEIKADRLVYGCCKLNKPLQEKVVDVSNEMVVFGDNYERDAGLDKVRQIDKIKPMALAILTKGTGRILECRNIAINSNNDKKAMLFYNKIPTNFYVVKKNIDFNKTIKLNNNINNMEEAQNTYQQPETPKNNDDLLVEKIVSTLSAKLDNIEKSINILTEAHNKMLEQKQENNNDEEADKKENGFFGGAPSVDDDEKTRFRKYKEMMTQKEAVDKAQKNNDDEEDKKENEDKEEDKKENCKTNADNQEGIDSLTMSFIDYLNNR